MRILEKEETKQFYDLHRSLLLFAHQQFPVSPKLQGVSDLSGVSYAEIDQILIALKTHIYSTENINKFCQTNPDSLSEDEIAIVKNWQYGYSGMAYVMKHLSSYSVFLSESDTEESKLYGVKGLYDDLEMMVPSNRLPFMLKVTLLPFKQHIIYDGVLEYKNIFFGGNIKRELTGRYNHIKAIHGVYTDYRPGDELSNPPSVSMPKDVIAYHIKQSLKTNLFPNRALAYAKEHNVRSLFEQLYTKHYVKDIKNFAKYNDDTLPPMYYAMYREGVVAVMPSRKQVLEFCQTHYPDILSYITVFKA